MDLKFDKLLQNLFSKIYLAEFALMNPLVNFDLNFNLIF